MAAQEIAASRPKCFEVGLTAMILPGTANKYHRYYTVSNAAAK